MKKHLFGKLLAGIALLCLILTAGWLETATAAAPNYVASIGVSQDGSSGSTGINDCKSELSGHIIIDRDLNEGAGGDYVYMGYKTTTDPNQAITGILFRVGGSPPHSIDYNGYTFNLVGGDYEANTAKLGGWIDLNARAGGYYIYTYVTRDRSYGAPLTELMVSGSSSVSGYYPGQNTDTSVMNLNLDAGGPALYLHYQRYSAKVEATYHYLTAAGARTNATMSTTLWTHLDTLTRTPYYSNSVTYDGRTFTFKGWREDNTATSTTVTPSVSVTNTPKTYRAVYSAPLTLSYNANGGSGAPSAQTATQYINAGSSSVNMESKTIKISSTKPSHADKCAFLGWSTSSSATSASYAPGDNISISSNRTLYAVWKDHSYTDNICTSCGLINPAITPVAHLSKNGKLVGAYPTLDAAVTAAEKCTAADNAVLQLKKSIALGASYQDIVSGVFTLDLNGYTISSTSESRYALGLQNSGTNVVITSSRNGGTIRSAYYGINASSDTALTVSDVAIIAEETGILLGTSASISNVSIDAGVLGIWARNSSTVTVTDCTIEAGMSALYIESKVTATVTGGSYTGSDKEEDIYVTGKVTVSGAAFPGGIAVDGKPLSAILAAGQAYWAGNTMIVPADGQKAITGRGDITVKAACTHEGGTKQDYVNNGDDHDYAYSCCGAIYTEAHAYRAENGLCLCGAINPDAVVVITQNDAVFAAYTTLDAAINVAEGCTAEDKAVVQLQKDIDLGTRSQNIGSGVFTLDLNGYTISGSDTAGTLNVGGVGTDVTITSSREGGTVSSLGIEDKGIETSSGTHITVSGITVIAEYDGIKLNGDAFISNVTIEAGGTGIFVDGGNVQIDECKICSGLEGIFSLEGSKLQVTDCTIEAGLCAVSVSSSAAEAVITGGSMTGGRITGFGNGFADIDAFGEVTVSGTTFPGGVKVTYKPLSDILAEGQAYWAGDRMIVPADGQMEINDMGDITVRPECSHSISLSYESAADGHIMTCKTCSNSFSQPHSYDTHTMICPCGAIHPDAVATVTTIDDFVTAYSLFENAFSKAQQTPDSTLTLLEYVHVNESPLKLGSTSFLLDLNGFSMFSDGDLLEVTNSGNDTVYISIGGTQGGNLISDGGTALTCSQGVDVKVGNVGLHGDRAVLVNESSSVTLSNCTIRGETVGVENNKGQVTVLSSSSIIGYTHDIVFCDESEFTWWGSTFPYGLTVSGGCIADLLGDGFACWQDNRQLILSDGQTKITGDVTIQEACKHAGDKTPYVSVDSSSHSFTCLVCQNVITVPHMYKPDTLLCLCGDVHPMAAAVVTGPESKTAIMSFENALEAWTDGTTLTLNQDVTYSTPITIPAGESRTLDLNGRTWTSTLTYTGPFAKAMLLDNQGALTITDTSSAKNGAIIQDSVSTAVVGSSGSLTIQGGRLQNKYHSVKLTGGTALFSGGVLVSTNHPSVILANSSLTVTGTALVEADTIGIDVQENASLNVTGGTIQGDSAAISVKSNASSAVIAGGTLSGDYGVECLRSVTLSGPANITAPRGAFRFSKNFPDARLCVDFDMSSVQTPYTVHMDSAGEFALATERGTLHPQAFMAADTNDSRNHKIIATAAGLAMAPCTHTEGFDEHGACLECGFVIELLMLVEDVQVTSANCGDVLGDGTVRYDFASQTLYLNNAHIEGDMEQNSVGIACPEGDDPLPLNIHLTGTNTVSCKGYAGILSDEACTITGDGSLETAGIWAYESLTISANVTSIATELPEVWSVCVGTLADTLTVTADGTLTTGALAKDAEYNAAILLHNDAQLDTPFINNGAVYLTSEVQTIHLESGSGKCGENAVSPSEDGVCLICGGTHDASHDGSMVTLPAAVQVIKAEAFLGTAMQQVKLPEGTLRIEARAFANSALTVISLPESIEFIADDAFEGCADLVIKAPEGSHAYEWAAEKGYLAD